MYQRDAFAVARGVHGPAWGCLIVIGALLAGCATQQRAGSGVTSPAANDTPRLRFVDVAKEHGLIEPLLGMQIDAAAWGDIDGDDDPDLFVGTFSGRRNDESYNVRGHTDGPRPNRLLINDEGAFRNHPQEALNIHATTSGAALADFDNDGDLDLVVLNLYRDSSRGGRRVVPNRIYRNDGDSQFIDVTEGSGLLIDPPFNGRTPIILDYDGDGRLDIFAQEDTWSHRYRSRLLRNTGDFRFEDVTEQAGLTGELAGLGGAAGDVNGDGWPDLIVAAVVEHERERERRGQTYEYVEATFATRLFINNRDGTFRDADATVFNENWPRATLREPTVAGAALGDLDNDGRIDVILGHHYQDTYRGDQRVGVHIYLNQGNDDQGNPRFTDITEQAGSPAIFNKLPQVAIEDFNNDGRKDIFTSAMMKVDGVFQPYILTNQGVRDGIPRFAAPPGTEPLRYSGWDPADNDTPDPRYTAVAPLVDIDADGRLDVFIGEWWADQASKLFRNTWAGGGYLTVRLRNDSAGSEPRWNRRGLGATVRVYEAGRADDPDALLGTAVIHVSNGYSSSQEAFAHFGLPGRRRVDVVATLPHDAGRLVRRNVPAHQRITLTESADRAE